MSGLYDFPEFSGEVWVSDACLLMGQESCACLNWGQWKWVLKDPFSLWSWNQPCWLQISPGFRWDWNTVGSLIRCLAIQLIRRCFDGLVCWSLWTPASSRHWPGCLDFVLSKVHRRPTKDFLWVWAYLITIFCTNTFEVKYKIISKGRRILSFSRIYW